MVRRAEKAHTDVRLAAEPFEQALREAGFADPGLAGHQHDTALASLRLVPAALQQRQFLVAADERRARRAQCVEAAFGAAFA